MRRLLAMLVGVVAALVVLYGAAIWHSNSNNERICDSTLGELSQSASSDAANQCTQATHDVDIGIACVVGGGAVFLLAVLSSRPKKQPQVVVVNSAPAGPANPPLGWMRVPYGCQPSNHQFMPVPTGWPPPPPEWVPPVGWLPAPDYPAIPYGWPQPPRPA
jgi:hypothetical protein